jgi:hypothetical protein
MLGTTLWLVVAIGLLAGVLLDAGAAFGRAAVHAAADHALEIAMNDAVADYQNQLQNAHASGAPPGALQRTYEAETADAASGTRFSVAYDVQPTTVAAPVCARGGEPGSGPDAVGWLQCNGFVAESRISLHVSVRVRDAGGGAMLAQREQYVTLRLFGEPPYSAVVGRKDAAAGDPAAIP